MPVSPRAAEWFRGSELGFVIEEDHFASRIAVLFAGATVITMLVRGAMSLGWSSPWSLFAGSICIMIAAATIWSSIRFGTRHLVLTVDRAGITFGPGLWAYLRRRDVRDFTPWRRISKVRLYTLDYAPEPDSYSLLRCHLQVTNRDGYQIERGLPPSVDLAAVERALRQFAPQSPSAEARAEIPSMRSSVCGQPPTSQGPRWAPGDGTPPGGPTAVVISLDGFR
jgi:hypothetical protein